MVERALRTAVGLLARCYSAAVGLIGTVYLSDRWPEIFRWRLNVIEW